MRIIFMGTPIYARVILEALLQRHTICALVCQEDKKAGRDMQLKMPATKEFLEAKQLKIPIFQPRNLDEGFVVKLREIPCDVMIVAAYGRILPKEVLEIAPCVNLHASILPRFRGASPIQQSILENQHYFGVTAMQMQEGLDCGDILGFKIIQNTGQNAIELFESLAKLAAELSLEYLERKDSIKPLAQLPTDATYCKKIKKELGLVAFDDAEVLYRKFLAYSGWPEIYLRSGLKLKQLSLAESQKKYQKGEILEITKHRIRIGCAKGSVWIGIVQAASKKQVPAYAYLQGRHLRVGDCLS